MSSDRLATASHETSSAPPTIWNRILASLVYSAPISPLIASVVTVFAYPSSGGHVIVAGLINLFAAWLVLAALVLIFGLSNKDRVDGSSHAALRTALDELECRSGEPNTGCQPSQPPDPPSGAQGADVHRSCACFPCPELEQHKAVIEREIKREGPQWVTGDAYGYLWRRMHLANAEWMYRAPVEHVIAAAEDAVLRLKGSQVDNHEDLTADLCNALPILRQCLAITASSASDTSKPSATVSHADELTARATVSRVSQAIDAYADDRWDGLRRARNHLLITMAAAGITVYLLLWLAILAGTPAATIRGAAAVYIVGAIVGVFNRLQGQADTATDVDDSGLSVARLMVAPELSGIAAVLGVVLVSLVGQSQDVASAFDLSKHPVNLVTAAVFGLTPGLLIERLKQSTEKTKDELRSIRPGEGQKGD